MEIENALKLKKELENNITNLINEFIKKTGCPLTNITTEVTSTYGEQKNGHTKIDFKLGY